MSSPRSHTKWIIVPWKWIRRSFRAKLVLSILAVVSLALSVVGATYYYRTAGEIERNTYLSLERLANQFVTTVELHLDSIRNEAWSYFSDVEVQNFVGNMGGDFAEQMYYRKKLNETVWRSTLIRSIALYGLNGKETLSTSGLRGIGMEAKEKKRVMEMALKNDGLGTWMMTKRQSTEEEIPTYTISYVQALKKITLFQQDVIGVLRIDLNVERLQELIFNLKPNYDGDFYVVNQDGMILLAENNSDMGKSLLTTPLYQAYKEASAASGRSTIESGGETWISMYQRFDTVQWAILGKIPMDQVLANVNQARKSTLSVALLSLGVALAVAYAISVSVTRPLRILRQSMRQIEQGNFHAAVPIKSYDEIGDLGLSFNRMSSKIRKLITEVYESDLLRKEVEIKALQSQINPHFLYNALGTIDSLASIQGDRRISMMSRALGNMFRYNISGGGMATVGDEIRQIEQYLFIQQMRFEDRLVYEIAVESALNDILIPKLLLQPIVENAVIHGVERKRGQVVIRVQARTEGDTDLWITVEDNGAGMTEEQLHGVRGTTKGMGKRQERKEQEEQESRGHGGKKSIGMANVNQRIQLLYGDPYGLKILSELGKGTTVNLVLPKTLDGGERL